MGKRIELYRQGPARSGKTDLLSLSLDGGDYTPLTGFHLFSAAASKDDASCHPIIATQLYLVSYFLALKKVGRLK